MLAHMGAMVFHKPDRRAQVYSYHLKYSYLIILSTYKNSLVFFTGRTQFI